MPNLLPVEDDEVSQTITKIYKKAGVNCLTDTKVTGTKDNGTSVTVTVENAQGTQEITAPPFPMSLPSAIFPAHHGWPIPPASRPCNVLTACSWKVMRLSK